MNLTKVLLPAMFFLFLFTVGLTAQDVQVDRDAAESMRNDSKRLGDIPAPITSLATIASTGSGGLWSSPSTWAGGVVPGVADNVVISPGTAVLIDTDVTVANITIGAQVSFNVGVLTFEPFAAHSFTVNGDLTIEGLGLLTTPTSNSTVTTHTITVGGNLTNNGILDLSTNNNLAGAGLVFTHASNNTFGGGGSMTDIRTITVNKGTSNASVLDLAVSNFTVQGSGIDTSTSGYLTLTNGTFKISGTFFGNHRTFNSASYTIPSTAGFWLNNANYTVAAQNGNAQVDGQLRISAGTLNQGTVSTNFLRNGDLGGLITVEGGGVNIAGSVKRSGFPGVSYSQSGGTFTTCIAGNDAPCFSLTGTGTGGSLVIQTPNPTPDPTNPDFDGGISAIGSPTATTLQFGNANTSGTGIFTCRNGNVPNVAINTASGPHTVRLVGGSIAIVRSVNIGSGGTLDVGTGQFWMTGDTFVNNGILQVVSTSNVNFLDPMLATLPNITYSGSGTFSVPINTFRVKATSLTFDPATTGFRTRAIEAETAQINNAEKIILGLNDAIASTIQITGTASFNSSPTFDLGTGGQKLIYSNAGTRTTGPEINPARQLVELTHRFSAATTTIAGGDVTLNGPLNISSGIIDTGVNKINHLSGEAVRLAVPPTGGFIRGTLKRRFTTSATGYSFLVGDNHYARVQVIASSLPSGTADVEVTPHDVTLPGLPPATSASFSWDIVQTGPMTSSLELNYEPSDISGNASNYRLWKSTGGTPQVVASTTNASIRNVTGQGITNLTAGWGISERLGTPVSISGGVFTSTGAGLRNAIVTIAGGTLTSPLVVQTGPFGTYSFQQLEAGFKYTVHVSAKRYRFATSTQMVVPTTDVANVNFTANPDE